MFQLRVLVSRNAHNSLLLGKAVCVVALAFKTLHLLTFLKALQQVRAPLVKSLLCTTGCVCYGMAYFYCRLCTNRLGS